MKKKIKNIIIFFCLLATIAIALMLYMKAARNQEIEAAKNIVHKRQTEEHIIRQKFSAAFAECAAKLLSKKAMEDFIIHETMPLGIAWEIANTNEDISEKSLSAYAAMRFHDYAERNDFFAERARSDKQLKLLSSTKKYPPMRWPDSAVYAASTSYNYRNQELKDINIGLNTLDWPPFSSLSKKCHAQPSDLEILLLSLDDQKNPKEINSWEFSPSALRENEKLHLMQRFFWIEFSKTEAFKETQEKIKIKNDSIIKTIIKNHKQQQKEIENEREISNKWIYK